MKILYLYIFVFDAMRRGLLPLVQPLECDFRFLDSATIFQKLHWAVKITIVVIVIVALVFIVVFLAVTRLLIRKRRRKRRSLDELRKAELSQGSLSHSEDDNNPDLIPQNTSKCANETGALCMIPVENLMRGGGSVQLQGSVAQC